MSEKRRMVHPQEPAEGEAEDVETPGVEKASDPSNPARADAMHEEERSAHPDEPAEGGEDEVDEPDVRTTPPERCPSLSYSPRT
jgi:hypothetical protein